MVESLNEDPLQARLLAQCQHELRREGDTLVNAGAFCPVAPLRFLCDEMLQGLGQWLRLAGYDAVMPVQGQADAAIIDRALRENRWLLTRDRGFLGRPRYTPHVLYLCGDSDDHGLRQLTWQLDLDWLYRPFSRCKQCNTPLQTLPADGARPGVPADVLREQACLSFCPRCEHYYWEGGHVRRMRARLHALNRWRRSEPT